MKLRRHIAFLLLASLAASLAPALEPVPEYQLKAEFLARFTLFIDWPQGALGGPNDPFVIGVVGPNPFHGFLADRTAGRRIKGRPVEVHTDVSLEEIDQCDMVFIARKARPLLDRILERTRNRPILTVADTPGFGARGVLINFYVEAEQVRFEINEAATRQSGLAVGSKLYRLARLVGPEAR